MAVKELTLEQRLLVLLASLEDSQKDHLTLLEGIAKERAGLQSEREKLGTLREELPKATQDGAREASLSIVERVAKGAADSVKTHQQPLLDKLTEAAGKAKTAEEQIKEALRELEGGWKMPALKLFGLWGVGLVVFGLVAWLVWSGFDFDERREEQEHAHLTEKNALLQQQHDTMKAEMEKWKAEGANQIRLENCPAPIEPLKCVRVDKARGAMGKNKDYFVPASVGD